MPNLSDKRTEKDIAIDIYRDKMHRLYEKMDQDGYDAYLSSRCMTTPKQRKLREKAFERNVEKAAEMVPERERDGAMLYFTDLITGVSFARNVIDAFAAIMVGYTGRIRGEEMTNIAHFIMDDIAAQDAEQWWKLCDLYEGALGITEETVVNEEKISTWQCDHIYDTVMPWEKRIDAVRSLTGISWLEQGLVRTIAVISGGDTPMFTSENPKKRNWRDFRYNKHSGHEREKWESVVALMHPDTVEGVCSAFKAYAWDVWKQFFENAKKRNSDFEYTHAEDIKRTAGKSAQLGTQTLKDLSGARDEQVTTAQEAKKKSKAVFDMLVGWSCPPSIEEQDTEDGEEASSPWMEYYRTRHSHGGAYYSPDLSAIREEEAYSLLFAAFLLWDISDDIMYLTTMAAWVVEAVCRKLPSFPAQTIENYQYTITHKKRGFVEGKSVAEVIGWSNELWCIPHREGASDGFLPVLPDKPEDTERAFKALTTRQVRFMHSRTLLPVPYYGHAIPPAPRVENMLPWILEMPPEITETHSDDILINTTLSVCNIRDYTCFYLLNKQKETFREIAEKEREKLNEAAQTQDTGELEEALMKARQALQDTQELLRQKNEEIRKLKKRAERGEQKETPQVEPETDASCEDEAAETEEVIEVPDEYTVSSKTVIVGGAQQFVLECQRTLNGDVRYIDANVAKPDYTICRGATVYINRFYIGHRTCNGVIAYCKKNGIDVQWFKSSGAKQSIRQLIGYERAKSKEVQA